MFSIPQDSFLGRRALAANDAKKQYAKHYRKSNAIKSLVFSVPMIAILFVQTGFYVRLFERPGGTEKIKQDMANDAAVQRGRREEYLANPKAKPIPQGLEFDHDLFTENELKMLTEAADLIKNNDALDSEFKNKFGVSLKALDALVVPAAEMIDQHCSGLGIEHKALQGVRSKSMWGVGGYTVRDGVGGIKATKDGRPRVAIKSKSFSTPRTLRRALLHEMFHVANVPAYYPSSLPLFQHDLVYWPDYRGLLERAQLNDDCFDNLWQLSDDCLDRIILVVMLGCFAILVYSLWIFYRLRSPRRQDTPI